MIRLKKDIQIGDEVHIPSNLSWQCASLSGDYTVAGRDEASDCYILANPRAAYPKPSRILVGQLALSYICGEDVGPAECSVSYNSHVLLPSDYDMPVLVRGTRSNDVTFIDGYGDNGDWYFYCAYVGGYDCIINHFFGSREWSRIKFRMNGRKK